MSKQRTDDDGVASIKDPRVTAARKGLEDRRLYLVEGTKMVRQALEEGASVVSMFFLDPLEGEAEELYEAARRAAPGCYRAARGIFFKVLGLGYETSTAALALVRVPEHDPESLLDGAGGAPDACYLLGQGIQDPRNVGVLVRTSDAFAATAFVLSSDSAFPWSRQSIRSTTGSVFRVRICLAPDLAGLIRRMKERGITIVGTSVAGSADFAQIDYRFPCAVVMGNETAGISEDVRALCDVCSRIPMEGKAHSLNVTVAGGIMLQELSRRRGAARGEATTAEGSRRDSAGRESPGDRGTA